MQLSRLLRSFIPSLVVHTKFLPKQRANARENRNADCYTGCGGASRKERPTKASRYCTDRQRSA